MKLSFEKKRVGNVSGPNAQYEKNGKKNPEYDAEIVFQRSFEFMVPKNSMQEIKNRDELLFGA